MLRVVPGVRKIYLVVRSKGGVIRCGDVTACTCVVCIQGMTASSSFISALLRYTHAEQPASCVTLLPVQASSG